jgi:DNA-binding MltR family transcriptional regulator
MSEPAYLKAFKELIRSEPTHADLPLMVWEFYGESDRAVILLSAALAELGIEIALKRYLRDDKSTEDLFDFEAPLGNFSGKIKLAFALNLFDKKTNHDLELIRHLRNGFAHSRHPLMFITPQVTNICKYLKLPDTDYAQIPAAYLSVLKDKEAAKDMTNPKTRYVTTCNTIAVTMVKYGRRDRSAPELSLPRLP